ncbi:hypothetical protein D0C36_08070 [Mucilaginibacter conchicola]|uniref:Uncharacterized protein n=1 Tax=Mucilaginibacter conchicola TaxID=2303333 RepID=A0A372P162_9SPHI|nr:hypothetical protein [Mucilaginibacter conchicola]RFZ95467.1 hypothetical protein D0C36_08070 [Mucilaginibacter conchicola]
MTKTAIISKNPLHYVYALIWLSLFTAMAVYIFTGKAFLPDANNKISVVAILIAWVAEYLTQTGTGILVLLIGLFVAYKTITVNQKQS